jgi:phosphocarrier protein FPr
MFPMVATLPELRRAKAILEEERAALGAAKIPVGIMVEVASVAVLADVFAPEVDFFSIGTNDLTQYTLAMDRGHPRLAPQVDALNPAVLRLIDTTVKAAHAHGRWVGVCGGIAGDPQAVPILVGLGVDELSVSVPVIAEIKARIRELRLPDCQALAATALRSATSEDVRRLSPEPTE